MGAVLSPFVFIAGGGPSGNALLLGNLQPGARFPGSGERAWVQARC
ncbi:hypothetical protein HUW62_24050 [Myxococcus sp. AM011]|nr:hypothetical protein [Myxococcus sp. AM011]NVJ24305.1 hypothetical protein [Myxococcus sp. AM011]